MTEVIALVTGTTGFLGQKFLNLISDSDRYADVITVGRGNKCASISHERPFYLKNLTSVEVHLFHFATFYNPKPKAFFEVEAILQSNIFFPMELLKTVPGVTQAYCMQSYQELLPINLQTEYSLSKRLFTKSLESCGISTHKFYLFDNFGIGDTRRKVVDIFIEKALAGVDIEIPSNDIFLNLCEVSNVVKNIFELIDSDCDTHLIGNKEKISLSELAHFIIYNTKSPSKVTLNGTSPDLLKYVKGDFTNITGYDNEALYEGLSEHIYYKKANTIKGCI